jgi:thiol-disulfide isomerase/thioredoxin
MPLLSHCLLSLLIIFSLACTNNTASTTGSATNDATVLVNGERILLGPISHTALKEAPFAQWYNSQYKDYRMKKDVVTALAANLDGITFRVFMGTWCEDSQMYVPAFFKILESMKYDPSTVKMVAVDHDKIEPKKDLDGYEIEYVPTIIIYRDGKAIGRIVEYPNQTLEEDLLGFIGKS